MTKGIYLFIVSKTLTHVVESSVIIAGELPYNENIYEIN